jgi:hypothetical protein
MVHMMYHRLLLLGFLWNITAYPKATATVDTKRITWANNDEDIEFLRPSKDTMRYLWESRLLPQATENCQSMDLETWAGFLCMEMVRPVSWCNKDGTATYNRSQQQDITCPVEGCGYNAGNTS